MPIPTKAAALAAGLVASLAAATIAQNAPAARPSVAGGESLVVGDATVDWIEKSDVAALREGVIDKMELQVGHEVARDGTIGSLHSEFAEKTRKKAAVAASSTASIAKAEAQKELALSVLARSKRLKSRGEQFVSIEEIQKNEAEVKVAEALVQEALENRRLAEAELELAQQALDEHTIKAPFDGVITERMKNPGESVRANEPVVRMGKIDKLRVSAWIPIDYAYRIRVGMPVEVSPSIPNAVLPIEQKKFLGKITFVDPEAEPVKTQVRIYAEVENNAEHELRPGLKADMMIYLNAVGAPAPPPVTIDAPAVGARGAVRPR